MTMPTGAAQLLRSLSHAMDPTCALDGLRPHDDVARILANRQPAPAAQKPAEMVAMADDPTNSFSVIDLSVGDEDEAELEEVDEDEIQPQRVPAPHRISHATPHATPRLRQSIDDCPMDSAMARIAPSALVRYMSSTSSCTDASSFDLESSSLPPSPCVRRPSVANV